MVYRTAIISVLFAVTSQFLFRIRCFKLVKKMKVLVISICFTTIFHLFIQRTNGKDVLHLGAMVSQEGPFGLTGFIPAMELALETIKNDETLPFTFEITLDDSMVSEYRYVYIIYRSRAVSL